MLSTLYRTGLCTATARSTEVARVVVAALMRKLWNMAVRMRQAVLTLGFGCVIVIEKFAPLMICDVFVPPVCEIHKKENNSDNR